MSYHILFIPQDLFEAICGNKPAGSIENQNSWQHSDPESLRNLVRFPII